VEQFGQHRKALLFDDDVRAAQILDTTEPNEQKKLGLKVTHFVPKIWSNINNVIIHKANYNKFTQNMHLEQELLATTGTTIAQACPFRENYCTGYYATEPNCQQRRSWNGYNIVGQILTNLRDEIIFKSKTINATLINTTGICFELEVDLGTQPQAYAPK